MTNKELQEQDYDWFLENMDKLHTEHGYKFVAIKNKTILGIYDTFDNAIESTMKTEELGTFLVQELYKESDSIIYTGGGWFDFRLPEIDN